MAEKFSNDLYSKYESLVSKLDLVEDSIKKSQSDCLTDLKGALDKISSSIVDVLSYVSEATPANLSNMDDKIAEIAGVLKENSLNYVEAVRDVVDVIRIQVENNLRSIENINASNIDSVKKSISENSEDIKKELKYSYSKLIEIQDSYNEIKELLNLNNIASSDKLEGILASAEGVKVDFESKISQVKGALIKFLILDKKFIMKTWQK